MSLSQDEIVKKLKSRGMRITKSRLDLIKFILSQVGHWTIQNLAGKILSKHPKLGIATVYRTINLLVDEKIISKTLSQDGVARYEVTSDDHHDHLTCIKCGIIVEFENEKIEALQKRVAAELGFELVDHRMELYGHCLNSKLCKK